MKKNFSNKIFDQANVSVDNIFLKFPENTSSDFNSETPKRLNDYDYNILKEEAYKDVSDERFKLEYRISKLENNLSEIDLQIQSARDISDYDTVEYLINRKKQMQDDLQSLVILYNDKGLSAKISSGVFNVLSPKLNSSLFSFSKALSYLKELIVSVLPNKFSSVLDIKQSLSKLETINKNVDDLMTMETPYGEADTKYEQLSKYIIRANSIHSKIAKSLK